MRKTGITVTHIITETHGGAGVAARRLHRGLSALGVKSRLIYRRGYCSEAGARRFEPAIRLSWRIREKVARYWFERQVRPGGGLVTDCRMPFPTTAQALAPDTDIFHLHWTAWFLDWPSFFLSLPPGSPVFLSLHDTTFISGGCHQLDGCERYQVGCGYCPKLRNPARGDVTARQFAHKQKLLSRCKLYVAANSSYTFEIARNSPLLKAAASLEIIPPGVDTSVFRPLEKEWCKDLLGMPQDKVILCFGAASTAYKNKGLDLLINCINSSPMHRSIYCLVFGMGGECLGELKCGWRFLGYSDSEHLMAAVYSAADIFIMPSRMETFGLTALEAMACGVPVIASRIGGLVDVVEDKSSGLLVPVDDVQAWTDALELLVGNRKMRMDFGQAGRERAEKNFDIREIAMRQYRYYQRIERTSQRK